MTSDAPSFERCPAATSSVRAATGVDLALGHHREVVPELERLVTEHPYREVLWRALMLALDRSGRAAAALGAYTRLRTELVEAFGLERSTDTQQLQHRILDQDPALDLPAGAPPTNLPVRLDSFVDRVAERRSVVSLLGAHRFVEVLAHDLDCSGDVTVARIPRGDFAARPEYWNGRTWGDDSAAAVPVIPCDDRKVNPTQVAVYNGRFVAVTKEGDWWGDVIYLDVAPAPEGPWQTYWSTLVQAECDLCNTYFASIVPFGAVEDSFIIALSCNSWTGDDLDHYNPTFMRVPARRSWTR